MTDLPEPDPIATDRRRARKQAKLPENAACAMCGATDPDVLLAVNRSLLEAHHVFGHSAAPDATVVLCRNHHAMQTAAQHDHDALPPLGRGVQRDSFLERLARALLSLAQCLHSVSHELTRFATQIFMFVKQLDIAVPGWRDWDLAQ